MDSVSIQMPNERAVTDQLVDAAADATKVRRALVGSGTVKAVAALLLAFFQAPGGVFLRNRALFYAYYGVLIAVAIFGAMEVGAGYWVSGDPQHRRGIGKLVIWASVVPLVLVAGLGGFAVLK